MNKTIYDSVCPKCGSDDWYQYDTDETEFSSDGTGHYYIGCHCCNCNNEWRQYYKFIYNVIEEWNSEDK